MSHAANNTSRSASDIKVDSLVAGLSFMLVVNLMQRGIGFARNLSLCHFLSEEMLGVWGMVASFLVFAPPLAVLGLPGTLTRFVEYFRQRGQLAGYVRRIAIVSCVTTITFLVGLNLNSDYSNQCFFGTKLDWWMTLGIVGTLIAVIGFNFQTELLSGMRQPKSVSSMQLVQSLSFTFLAIPCLYFWADWRVLVFCYGMATVLGCGIGLRAVFKVRDSFFVDSTTLSWLDLARRIVPYAMAMWMMNVLANAFEVLDKYMLLHMATTPHAGQGAVGQFHSGMIIPALLSSLTMMLGGLVLPYLSADWENGKKDQIRLNLQMIFKAIAFGFTLLSASALMVAPWIFEGLLSNRYQDGLQLLPIALAHCIWMSIATLMQSYLWCREKGRSIALATGSGIALNFVLNLWLIPRFGTQGAILATAASGILILCITMLLLESLQCKMDRRTYLFALLPFTLMVYAEFSLAAIAMVAFVCSKSDFLLSHKEKEGIDRAIVPSLEKLGLKIKTLW